MAKKIKPQEPDLLALADQVHGDAGDGAEDGDSEPEPEPEPEE